jgi:hypothetical protein
MPDNITVLQVFVDGRTGICSRAVRDVIEPRTEHSEYIDEISDYKPITLGDEADYFTLHSLFVLPDSDSISFTLVWDAASGWYPVANEYFS